MSTRSDPSGSAETVSLSRWPIQPRRDAMLAASTVFLAFTAVVVLAWRAALDHQRNYVLADVARSAEAAARMLDREVYAKLTSGCDSDDEIHHLESQHLELFKSTQSRLASLYLIACRPTGFQLVLSTPDLPDADARLRQPAAREALASGQTRTSSEYESALGAIVSVYAPLSGTDGRVLALVGADVLENRLRSLGGSADQVLIYGALFTVACMIGMGALVYKLRSSMRDVMLTQETRMLALERNAEHLKRAQEQAGTVLASMSHEVRTPLTAILGFTELLLEPSDDVDVLRRHAQTIRRNSQHLLGVLNDALDMSKIDAGMMRIHRQPFDPRALVREIIELYLPRAHEKGVELRCEIGVVPENVDSDEQRVRQILINLLSNGLKFTERGEVVVRADYDSSPAVLRLEVQDTGIGISPEHIDSIFRPYQQAVNEDVRRFGGTGLGLAISQRLAGLLGGRLTVASRPGEGATFLLSIPAPEVGAQELADRQKLLVPEPWKPRPSWHVLIVEDTLEHQKILYALLRRAGHSAEVCETGERAVKLVREAEYVREPYTVIVMDAHLSGMSGAATARAMREHGYRGPIVGLTADQAEGTRQDLLLGGCNDVLTKPIERERFIAALSRLLHGSQSAGAA